MSTLKKIFITIIFLSVISLTPILKIKALEIPNKSQLFDHITNQVNSNYQNNCDYIAIFYNNNSSTWKYYCTTFDLFNSGVNSNNISGNRFLDLRTNFYGLYNIRGKNSTNLGTNYYMGAYGTYNGSTWSSSCMYGTCQYYYDLTSNDYLVAFFKVLNIYSTGYYVTNSTLTSSLFYPNYNLEYYETPVDYMSTYSNYFGQPTNVKGSEIDFSGEELNASVLDFSYAYYNTFMYEFSNVDNETTLISHTYTYDNISLTGNYELGFVITTKRYNDTPLIVHAITDNTYACSVTPVKSAYDYNYQYYVNCPSVPFDNIDTLKIVVNGSNEYYLRTGPFPIYDTQYIFNSSNNNKYVGISAILRNSTNVAPTPIQPDTPPQDDIIQSITDMNNNIMDPNGPDTSILSNSAGWLPAGPVDSIVNLPITMLSSLNNVLSSSTCSPVSVPIPFINFNYSLPCLNTIINNMGFSTWWEWVGTVASAFILYKYLINLYAWVDKTLTFRENNWNDWGGI